LAPCPAARGLLGGAVQRPPRRYNRAFFIKGLTFEVPEMPARKTMAKSAKGKKPVASKPAAKKAAPPTRKPASKPVARASATSGKSAASAKSKTPTKPVSKDLDKKPAVTASLKKTAQKPAEPKKLPVPARAVGAAEAAETGDSSLLAGPRNVKPYVAKRGEVYMSREQLNHFRQILTHWKRDLMEEVDRTVSHMKDEAANFPDPNDRATQEEEFSLELRTRDRERKLIRKIEEAIQRIEDGSYGYCLETGEPIGIKRLEARPVATLSLEAQERRERREKQYGDRDDRYR
jgi:DnaK suppressor protein